MQKFLQKTVKTMWQSPGFFDTLNTVIEPVNPHQNQSTYHFIWLAHFHLPFSIKKEKNCIF